MTTSPLSEALARLQTQVGIDQHHDLGTISELSFRRFAMAAGDLSGRYHDPVAAAAEGFEDLVAPPLYLSSVFGWNAGPSPDQLRPDGAAADRHTGMKLEGLRLMGAGQEIEFFDDVYDGDRVLAVSTLERVVLKEGHSGVFLLIVLLWRYVLDSGSLISTNRETIVAR